MKKRIVDISVILFDTVRKDFSTKFFFLFIGVFAWLNINLEKEFETNIIVPIEVSRIRSGYTLLNEIPQKAKIKVKAKGKALIFSDFVNALYFDLDFSDVKDTKQITLRKKILENKTGNLIDLKSVIYPTKIFAELDSLVFKTIPVKIRSEFSLAPGYIESGEFVVNPEKITISGPLKKINKIKTLYTKRSLDSNLTSDFEKTVPIIKKDTSSIKYSHSELHLYQKIVKKGTNVIKKLITLKNKPRNKNININPIAVEIEITGPVNELIDITQNDFDVYIDCNKLKKSDKKVKISSTSKIPLKWRLLNEEVQLIEF